jgi:hypothetical protein
LICVFLVFTFFWVFFHFLSKIDCGFNLAQSKKAYLRILKE